MKRFILVSVAAVASTVALFITAIVFIAGNQPSALTVSTIQNVGMTLTPAQEVGCGTLASYMNYDHNAVRAWCAAEGNVGNPGQPANNLLFLSCGVPEQDGCITLNGRRWATFPSVEVGAIAMWNNLARNPNLYGGVLAASGSDPVTEMQAIAVSPWDAGHYGNPPGTNLIADYDTLLGIRISCSGAKVCAV